ncbi:tumor necrosis factor receptor superfamily member 6 [Triplophysa dalaica]|uniref:tumor necrosis factor receptor superfamily member 6 n=1 Tax=Triplophysa dalaica TaxID=1582913 RepID=UPI0024DFF24A|nr:tumor necrosis factor receptor superfamily member 6 [Triplophysa dalaica]
MYFYKLVVSVLCLTMSVGLAEGRRMRRRRGVCEYGTYPHLGKTCCLCPSGYRVISDCEDNIATQCEICQDGFFATHPNSEHTCHRCRDCDPERTKMEMTDSCSRNSDAVCECQENYYCDKGHLCRTCQPCDKCEEQGAVERPCTLTKNTVCRAVKMSKGGIVAVVVVTVILIIGPLMVVCFLHQKKKFCFKDRQKKDDPKLQELLPKAVDIVPYLHEIASTLQQKNMIDVARRTGMSEADIEQHEINHPRDVKEQTYRLLVDWSQSQGLYEAYPTLIEILLELKAKTTADRIKQIVQREPVKNI